MKPLLAILWLLPLYPLLTAPVLTFFVHVYMNIHTGELNTLSVHCAMDIFI